MNYNTTIYINDKNNLSRFVLGNITKKTLFVIGLNPSIADETNPDPTLRKVLGFAERNNFDSFVMLNLYPQRATYPKDLHTEVDEVLFTKNLDEIKKILMQVENPTILASWGEKITERKYFLNCIKSIYDLTLKMNVNWVKIGELTKKGHPRHPLYPKYDLGLTDFKVINYIEKLK